MLRKPVLESAVQVPSSVPSPLSPASAPERHSGGPIPFLSARSLFGVLEIPPDNQVNRCLGCLYPLAQLPIRLRGDLPMTGWGGGMEWMDRWHGRKGQRWKEWTKS